MNDRAAKSGKRKSRASTPAESRKAAASKEARGKDPKEGPRLGEFLPGLLLVAVNYAFFLFVWQRHFHLMAGGIGLSTLLALPFVNKIPFTQNAVATVAGDIVQLYANRGVWVALGALLVLQIGASPFVGSIHIIGPAEVKSSVALYRLADRGDEPTVVDSGRIENPNAHLDFVYRTKPGRVTWLRSSTFFHTRAFRSRFVTIDSARYPMSFDTLVTVAILPAPELLTGMQNGNPLRLIVIKDGPRSFTLTDTSFTSVASFVLSQAEPPPPDTVTRRRWLQLLQKRLQVDTSLVVDLVNDWVTRSRWMKVRQPLSRRNRLRTVVLNPNGDTLAVDTFTIASPLHDAFTKRR